MSQRIRLSSKGINRFSIFPNNFKFVVPTFKDELTIENVEYFCPESVASILSPNLALQLKEGFSKNSFAIQEIDRFHIFPFVLDLGFGKEIDLSQFTDSEINAIKTYGYILQNDKIFNIDIDDENLCLEFKTIEEISTDLIKYQYQLYLCPMKDICQYFNSYFTFSCDDHTLFKIIHKLYELKQNEEILQFYQYVDFNYVDPKYIQILLNDLKDKDIILPNQIWKTCQDRLLQVNSIQGNKIYYEQCKIQKAPEPNSPGILEILSSQFLINSYPELQPFIHEISVFSLFPVTKDIPKLLNFYEDCPKGVRDDSNDYLNTKNFPSIIYDFGNLRIQPNCYRISSLTVSSHLTNWKLYGNIDLNENWVLIDEQIKCYELNSKNSISIRLRPIPQQFFKYIKLEQSYLNTSQTLSLFINHLDVYGIVQYPSDFKPP